MDKVLEVEIKLDGYTRYPGDPEDACRYCLRGSCFRTENLVTLFNRDPRGLKYFIMVCHNCRHKIDNTNYQE